MTNVFIDSNIFLNLYHFSKNDLDELKKLTILIRNKKVTLWLPDQVKIEVEKNRESKILNALNGIKSDHAKKGFPQICLHYDIFSTIDEIDEEKSKKINDLINAIEKDIAEKNLEADKVIQEIFNESTCIESDTSLLSLARDRVEVGKPPGKKDSLGDAINWEALLMRVPENEDLYLLTEDKDYVSVVDEKNIKNFLKNEWEGKKKSTVIIYDKLSSFFQKKFPEIKISSEKLEMELAVNRLISSSCFAVTHDAINGIENNGDLDHAQASKLVQALFENNQIKWILSDNDVLNFYRNIYEKYKDEIGEENAEKLRKELEKLTPNT